jgi:3-hydroxyisobutyrate dehydrogenase-like beta-hydroxyacid dehydrogenase
MRSTNFKTSEIMTDISILGLGDMGSALANTLLHNGYSVTVWNRPSEKTSPLIASGALLSNSPTEAIAASPATIMCIKSHDTTIQLFENINLSLTSKTIIEFSTGGVTEAETLVGLLSERGADWIIGCIRSYPSMIGDKSVRIITAAKQNVWEKWQGLIKMPGGSSVYVGDRARMVPTLFAAFFITGQGFLFGMIYGGIVWKKAGISLEEFARFVPTNMESLHNYFSNSVADEIYESPDASMTTYANVLDDALGTFDALGASSELPQLFSEQVRKGIDAGLDTKSLTALIDLLAKS